MTEFSKSSYLNETVGLLIKHFGGDKVRLAVSKALGETPQKTTSPKSRPISGFIEHNRPTIASALDDLRESQTEKYELLAAFYEKLKRGDVLRESQDIRNFIQFFGVKQIDGKSRKEAIPNLMRLLLSTPIEQLRQRIRMADGISHDERRRGFSVLTDKLVGRG
jgi:hypothetical protein